MKILIIGHGTHGKNTVGDYISKKTRLSNTSSSYFKRFDVYNFLKSRYDYKSVDECYSDRRNKRTDWSEFLDEYSEKDKSRLAREIVEEYDIYIGMRNLSEFEASSYLFDHIIYVDASGRTDEIDSSMEINKSDYRITHHISNNSNIESLYNEIDNFLNENYAKRNC